METRQQIQTIFMASAKKAGQIILSHSKNKIPVFTFSNNSDVHNYNVSDALRAFFVDEVANISIAPNGACRLSFATWSTDNEGQAQRIDSEVILTISTLKSLAEALPKAIEQADAVMKQRQVSSNSSGMVQ